LYQSQQGIIERFVRPDGQESSRLRGRRRHGSDSKKNLSSSWGRSRRFHLAALFQQSLEFGDHLEILDAPRSPFELNQLFQLRASSSRMFAN
jgi:hypothetical protein